MVATLQAQTAFYREFLMSRYSFKPQEFGVDMDRAAFDDLMVEEFQEAYRSWTFDELLLHPAEALQFCSDVRRKRGWFDMPDDIILRVILARRKRPS